jgi:hypothetical protein
MRDLAVCLALGLLLAASCGEGGGPAQPTEVADSQAGDTAGAEDTPDGVEPVNGTWGWISVIEENDFASNWGGYKDWFGGVRAYFATRPSWPRALEYQLGYTTPLATVGACTLYDAGLFGEGCEDCFCLDASIDCNNGLDDRWCDPDEMCVLGPKNPETWPDRGVCQALPPHFEVGTISIEGLKLPVVMSPDQYDRYQFQGLPSNADLFDDGDLVTVRSTGGALAPIELVAPGVVHLQVHDDGVVRVTPGQDSLVRWLPADPDARVMVVLRSGSHDPYPLSAAIVCEAEDATGQVEVAAELLEGLVHLGCDGAFMLKVSGAFRYQRAVQSFSDGEVELFVASARSLQIVLD